MFEKDLSRSNRRHHNERLKKNRKNYHGFSKSYPATERHIGIYLHTPALCSCHMCGNARKLHKSVTLQEVKFLDVLQDGLSEV